MKWTNNIVLILSLLSCLLASAQSSRSGHHVDVNSDVYPSYTTILGVHQSYSSQKYQIDPSNEIVLNVILNANQPEAKVYCGVFQIFDPRSSTLNSQLLFSNISEIIAQNFSTISENHRASLIITGMMAVSQYRAYCLTMSTEDNEIMTPFEVIAKQSTRIVTMCCKIATFRNNLSQIETLQNSHNLHNGAMTFLLNAAPTSDILFTFNLQLITTEDEGRNEDVNGEYRDMYSQRQSIAEYYEAKESKQIELDSIHRELRSRNEDIDQTFTDTDTETTQSALVQQEYPTLSLTELNIPRSYVPYTVYQIYLQTGTLKGRYKIEVNMYGETVDEYNLFIEGSSVVEVI